jgi:hypothetical protein
MDFTGRVIFRAAQCRLLKKPVSLSLLPNFTLGSTMIHTTHVLSATAEVNPLQAPPLPVSLSDITVHRENDKE